MAAAEEKATLRIGIIGLTTSHVPAFTKVINRPRCQPARWPRWKSWRGSPAACRTTSRVGDDREGFTKQLQDMADQDLRTIDELVENVDAVLLESVDGRPHLEQAKPVIAAGKPLFIDKPMAGVTGRCDRDIPAGQGGQRTLLLQLVTAIRVGIPKDAERETGGRDHRLQCVEPLFLEEHHPDLFWYGVHGVEILYTIMGTGCQSVTRVFTPGTDLVVGVWEGGRIGTFRGIRNGKAGYGANVFSAARRSCPAVNTTDTSRW